MNPRIAFPFLTLSDSAVSATAWQVSLDGSDWAEVGEHLRDWDPSSTMRLRRTICVVSNIAVRDLSIPEDQLQLAMSVRIGTGQGRLPRTILARHRRVLEIASQKCEFELELAGEHLSVVLDLLTEITLASPAYSLAALAPRAAGNRLWADSTRLRLESAEPRFPIETADLTTLFGATIAASAPWHLHWSPRHWERDFHGAVCLYLNERANAFLDRVKNQDDATLQLLLADVMGQICERFVVDPEVNEMMEGAERGSLAGQAAIWLRKAWPGRDAAFVRSILENQPGVFRSAFLALAEIGEE
jgi:hypothetical protein